MKIAKFIVDNKDEFTKVFIENKQSTSKYFNFFTFQQSEEIKEHNLMYGKKRAHLDLKNFYPSLYTHTIPWIIIGRNAAKNRSKTTPKEKFANSLDEHIMWLQSRETKGIPTGNLISRIIAELYMCYFDKRISQIDGKDDIKYSRYVDDILFPYNSESEFQSFLSKFNKLERQYELTLNEAKLEIEEYPFEDKMDKTEVFNYLFSEKINKNTKNKTKKIIKNISKYIEFCSKEEHKENKGSLKILFNSVINYLNELKKERIINSEDINEIFTKTDEFTEFNLYLKFIDTSFNKSTLVNRFVYFTKKLIKLGVDSDKLKQEMNEYFDQQNDKLKANLKLYIKLAKHQEMYQILLYCVLFDVKNFYSGEELLELVTTDWDDFSICLALILMLAENNNDVEQKIDQSIGKIYQEIDGDDEPRAKFMFNKMWFCRYFIFALEKKKLINEDKINIKNIKKSKVLANKDDKIAKFYLKLLELDINFVSLGRDNSFKYL